MTIAPIRVFSGFARDPVGDFPPIHRRAPEMVRIRAGMVGTDGDHCLVF